MSHNQNQNAVHPFQNYGPSQLIFSNNGQHMLFQFTVKLLNNDQNMISVYSQNMLYKVMLSTCHLYLHSNHV